MTITDDIKNKLKKLLALSASDNEHEARRAMEYAQALMNKYNLRVADVAMDGSGAHIKNQDIFGATKQTPQWLSSLGWAIASAFDGQAILSQNSWDEYRRQYGWKMTFVAGRSDLEIIIDLYERLNQTIPRMSEQFVKAEKQRGNPIHPKTLHNSYRHGLVATISERLYLLQANTRPAPDKPVTAGGITGKELMVVKEKAVEQRINKMFPHLSHTSQQSSARDGNAYQQGIADGHNVSLHRSVGSGNGPLSISY